MCLQICKCACSFYDKIKANDMGTIAAAQLVFHILRRNTEKFMRNYTIYLSG